MNTRPAHAKGRLSAFFYGMAHALDLGGTLARDRGRFAGGFESDARALRGDWERAFQSFDGVVDARAESEAE